MYNLILILYLVKDSNIHREVIVIPNIVTETRCSIISVDIIGKLNKLEPPIVTISFCEKTL